MRNMQLWFENFLALTASFTLTTALMPMFILYFTNKKIGQMTREEGPSWHEVKAGTPTMGGIAFVIASLLVFTAITLIKGVFDFTSLAIILVLVGFGAIGFIDDYLKLIRNHNEGLTSRQKFIAQVVCSVLFVLVYFATGREGVLFGISNNVLYALFAIIWMTGFSNAVNLTDGLDGLVAGLSTIALSAYAIIAYRQEQYNIMLFCLTLIGGLLGFFIFNKKPAKIFMGDVGSLALGGLFAVLSMLLHHEMSLLLIGIVFVIETASVILQVGSFKLRGKRIFKMSPIHHHFEMSGWSEWQVVLVFWGVGLLGAILYLWLF